MVENFLIRIHLHQDQKLPMLDVLHSGVEVLLKEVGLEIQPGNSTRVPKLTPNRHPPVIGITAK